MSPSTRAIMELCVWAEVGVMVTHPQRAQAGIEDLIAFDVNAYGDVTSKRGRWRLYASFRANHSSSGKEIGCRQLLA